MAVETLNYLRFDVNNTPKQGFQASVKMATGELLIKPLVPGYALLDTRGSQFGTCTSKAGRGGYYANRFAKDLERIDNRREYFARLYGAVVEKTDEAIDIAGHSGFHEGFGRITEASPDTNRAPVPVLTYAPVIENGQITGLQRRVVTSNFQEGFKRGGLAVFNPAVVCDTHSDANNIDPKTGWPAQCNRDTNNGHEPKATRGHTEAIGT